MSRANRGMVVFAALSAHPAAALACSVCQDPNDARAKAYFDMTMFLSLFPLLAMGTVAVWLYRQYTLPTPT